MKKTICYFLFAFSFWHSTDFSYGADALAASKLINPDISVNILGLARHGTGISNNRTVVPHNGFSLQEAEIRFTSDVDPYLKASATFSVSQENGSSGYGIDPEEVYIETISLPVVTWQAGKFKMALGKHNLLHTHAFPFIDAPLIHQRLLGDEGLNEVGVSGAALLPFVPWFSELTLQAFSLENEALFASRSSGDAGGLVHYKNLWDLSDSTTAEFGLSALSGNNQYGRKSNLFGSDFTLKWRPTVNGRRHALVWTSEVLIGQRIGKTADRDIADPSSPGSTITITESVKKLGGYVTWLQYQFSERWWAQGRYERVGTPQSETPSLKKVNKQSALLGFFPSEFSGLRFQYDRIRDGARPRTDHSFALQFNVSIGAHPAHAY